MRVSRAANGLAPGGGGGGGAGGGGGGRAPPRRSSGPVRNVLIASSTRSSARSGNEKRRARVESDTGIEGSWGRSAGQSGRWPAGCRNEPVNDSRGARSLRRCADCPDPGILGGMVVEIG